MTKFRFEDLEIWEIAIELADRLFDVADELERKKLYRFAGQLRGAGMSMSNNIAKPGLFTKKLCREQGVGEKVTEEYLMYSEYALFPYNEALGKISPQNCSLNLGWYPFKVFAKFLMLYIESQLSPGIMRAKVLVQDQTKFLFSIWNMPETPPLKMQTLQS